MKVDNPQAFRFILQEEIYLLDNDKANLIAPHVPEAPKAVTPVKEVMPPETVAPHEEHITTPAAVAPAAVSVITPANEFNYLGNNNKNFVVLVNYVNEEHIDPTHLTALENILKRKNLTMADVAILNVNKYSPVKLSQIAACFAPTRLVIMGKDALPEGIGRLPLNQPLQGKKTHVLYSFSFDEMMSSNDNKKIFWEHMKTL